MAFFLQREDEGISNSLKTKNHKIVVSLRTHLNKWVALWTTYLNWIKNFRTVNGHAHACYDTSYLINRELSFLLI